MERFNDILIAASDWLWGWPMIIMLLGTHVYLTIRLKVPQRRLWTAIKLSVTRDKDAGGAGSPFGAPAPATVAASLLNGVITDPRPYLD